LATRRLRKLSKNKPYYYLETAGTQRTLGRPAVFDQAPCFWSHGLATAGLPLREWEQLPPDMQAAKVDSVGRVSRGE
jgi:hypothetical protein